MVAKRLTGGRIQISGGQLDCTLNEHEVPAWIAYYEMLEGLCNCAQFGSCADQLREIYFDKKSFVCAQ